MINAYRSKGCQVLTKLLVVYAVENNRRLFTTTSVNFFVKHYNNELTWGLNQRIRGIFKWQRLAIPAIFGKKHPNIHFITHEVFMGGRVCITISEMLFKGSMIQRTKEPVFWGYQIPNIKY